MDTHRDPYDVCCAELPKQTLSVAVFYCERHLSYTVATYLAREDGREPQLLHSEHLHLGPFDGRDVARKLAITYIDQLLP